MNRSADGIAILPDEERERRREAIDYARASMRLEGFILDEAAESLFARYVEGNITRLELNEAVQKLAASYDAVVADPVS